MEERWGSAFIRMAFADAGVGDIMVQLYGSSLAGSPAFTRFFLDPLVNSPSLNIPADTVFVEHYAAGSSGYIEPLAKEGFFIIGFADLGGREASRNDFSKYDEVLAAGANIVLTEYLVPAEFRAGRSEYSAQLPCGDESYCVLPSNSTAPPRRPPDGDFSTESGITTLKPVPTQVEPRMPVGFETGAAAGQRQYAVVMTAFAAALLLAL
jgi:hypothetical protein